MLFQLRNLAFVREKTGDIEKAKNEWELTVDSLPELIVLIDKDRKAIRANMTLEKWGIGSVRDVAGYDLHKILHPHCREFGCKLERKILLAWRDFKDGQNSKFEHFDASSNRYLNFEIKPIKLYKHKTFFHSCEALIIATDVSEKKKMAYQLVDMYRHFGILNRRISILQSTSQKENGNNQNEIADDLLRSFYEFIKSKDVLMIRWNQKNELSKEITFVSQEKLSKKKRSNLQSEKIDRSKIADMFLVHTNWLHVSNQEKIGDEIKNIVKYFGEISNYLVFPNFKKGKISGLLLATFNRKIELTDEEIDFCSVFASHIFLQINEVDKSNINNDK